MRDAIRLLQQTQAAHQFNPTNFLAFEVGAQRAGWIRRDYAELLRRWPEIFEISDGQLCLAASLPDEPSRTAALANVTCALECDGAITGWRDETYAIRIRPDDAPLFHIERAAVRFFGLTSAASHLNGFVRNESGLRIWIARRSPTKSIDPGLLDTLVGGGIPSGQDAWQALLRECQEEAGIERGHAMRASASGALAVCHEVPEGLHSEILHAHDLDVTPDFQPRNVDGEVSEFMQLSTGEAVDHIANGEFTVEAGLVTLDFLVRRHAIAPDPEVLAALDRCRVRP